MLKRLFDIAVSATGLIISAPITLTAAAVIAKKLGKPVLFRQVRPGQDGKPFEIYKFRTMSDKRDENGELLPDDQRMTPVGTFIRKSSIDELPQLINVLKGDISLVGPRPLLMEYLPLYNDEQKKRHNVKPGITGWAQVNGRNAISWDEKFKLDVWYAENQSFKLDMYIIYKTIINILQRKDINAPNHVTAEKFKDKDECFFVIAIGNNYVRQKLFNSLDIPVNQYATLVHPSAIVSSSAKIECGTVVMPHAVINADTTIGKHVIINTGAIIEHDNNIADYVHVSPNATLAGGVTVGEASHIAINAGVLPLVEIGSHCIVGAGATVINHVKSESTVVGTPAKTKE